MVEAPPLVDQAQPADAAVLLEILHSRPGADPGGWQPVEGAVWLVARDSDGIAAFLSVRIDLDRHEIMADQLECWWADGNPTPRGMRGLAVLGDFLLAKARQLGCIIYSVVASDNARHVKALERRGFRLTSLVYAWRPEED